jgi:hypothetical protein
MWASFTVPGEEFEWWRVPCPLDAQPPTAGCGTGGGTVWEVEVFTADLTVGDTTVQDVRHKWFGINGGYYVLAAGLGEVLRQPKFDPPDRLVYARVAGVEYGAPRFPVAVEPVPERPEAFAVEVRPNPVRDGPTRVTLALDRAGDVALDVFDALGHRVAGRAAGRRGAGAHALPLDVAGLAPGVYVVRAVATDAGGAARVVTRRLTVIR